jgi:spermidine/putrescine-binding protein
MKKALLLAVLLSMLVLAACGGGPSGGPSAGPASAPAQADTAAESESSDGPQLAAQLSVYNWTDYIADEVLAKYEEEFGVDIIYDTFASNEDLLAKLSAGATGYDVIFPSDYMVAQMIELGLLAEIDVTQLSNFGNLDPAFINPPFDPGNAHCVPYQWGTTGIGYQVNDPAFADGAPTSWAYLYDPAVLAQYADRGVNVLNDQRELIATALFYLGYDPNTQDRAQLEEARDVILQAKPFWRTFNSEDYDDSLMIPGEITLSQAWSGDAANAIWNTVDDATGESAWAYAIPEEGAVKWLDNICIPASTERYETALHFMNYLLEAENAAAITNYTYYASPNLAAREFIDEEILNDPGIFPPEEVTAKLQWLTDVGDAIFTYDEMWTAIKGQ